MQEWTKPQTEGLNDNEHASETIAFMVVEAGFFALNGDNSIVMAGRIFISPT